MAPPVLSANSPGAGSIAWTAFHIQYQGSAYAVAAGNTANKYTVWQWNGGAPSLGFTDVPPIDSATQNGTPGGSWASNPIVGPDDLLLFINRSGVPINVQQSKLVQGDLVATGTITSQSIATGTITATQIAAGTITGNNIAGNTITAGLIQAGAITTSKIATGAVTATQIAAGSITAEKLTIGSLGDNLIQNSKMEDASQADPTKPAAWTYPFISVGNGGTPLWAADMSGNHSLGITNTINDGGSWGSAAFPVQAGQTYAFQALVQSMSTTGAAVRLRVWWGTAQGMSASANLVTATPSAAQNVSVLDMTTQAVTSPGGGTGAGYTDIITGWQPTTTNVKQVSAQVVAPTGAIWAVVGLANMNSAAGGNTTYFDNVMFLPVIVSARIANGAITAQQIAANTITATQIAGGTITANQIATGTITTNLLSATAINGMTITGNSISGASITGSTIQTSGSVNMFMSGSSLQLNTGSGSQGAPGGLNVYANANSMQVSLYAPQWAGGNIPRFDLYSNSDGSGSLNSNAVWTHSGPLTVTGGITSNSGVNLTANGPLVANNGVTINNGGLSVTGGLQVNSNIAMNNNTFYIRASNDPNHTIVYNSTNDGPQIMGYAGVRFVQNNNGAWMHFHCPNATTPTLGNSSNDTSVFQTNTGVGSGNYAVSGYKAMYATSFSVQSSEVGKENIELVDGKWALDVIKAAPSKKWQYHNVKTKIVTNEDGLEEVVHLNEPKTGPNGEILSAAGDETWHFSPVWEEVHADVRHPEMKLDLRDLIGVVWSAVQELSDQVDALKGSRG